MSGLRPFPVLQDALDAMDPTGHGPVGWSILCSLARAQIRRGSSVVLDGIARAVDVDLCRRVAIEEGAVLVIVLTECTDLENHRARIEGRRREIPNWYELDWPHVERTKSTWIPPAEVDLRLDAVDPAEMNQTRLSQLFQNGS
jgi:hypothetical protein